MIRPENLPTACPQDAKTALVLTLTALQLKVLAALAALELNKYRPTTQSFGCFGRPETQFLIHPYRPETQNKTYEYIGSHFFPVVNQLLIR